MIDSNHDIVPTLRMFDGLVMGHAADEIERLRKELAALRAQPVQTAPLTDIDELAKVYSIGYASPHHITFTVEGLRSMIQAAQVAQSVQPAALITNCTCKWNGDVYELRCDLHESWFVAMHEWAERAKTAEAKLAQPAAYDTRQFSTQSNQAHGFAQPVQPKATS